MTAILRAEGLCYSFPGGITALRDLSLTVRRGRKLAILGPNGAGKSTLFLHLNGTLRPSAGRIEVQGQPGSYSRKGLADWRKVVGLVLQDADDQLFAATVFEDVSFGPLNLGLDREAARARVEAALQALNLTELRDRATHMLSGGQKKRAAIAGAVAMQPQILLLDEPTAGLDHRATEDLITLLERLSADGMTLVFSTHDVDLAHRLADDVALFHDGAVIAQGEATEILSNPALLAQVHLRQPLLLQIALAARAHGLLTHGAPLPYTTEGLIQLMQNWSPRV